MNIILESTTLLRPNNMQQISSNSNNSNLTEACNNGDKMKTDVRLMPDPEEIFSTTLGGADTSQSFVRVPNICNNDGSIITPDEYETKLLDGSIVMVNVSLKM
jgi:hypothetical protein